MRITLAFTATDTEKFATKKGAAWPCFSLKGKRVEVELNESGDVVDFTANTVGFSVHELNALIADALTAAAEEARRRADNA